MSKISSHNVEFNYSFIRIMTGSDLSRRRLPMMIARCPEPRPLLWLTACVHGDEVGGMVVIQEIFKRIRRGGMVKGTICAFPLMNPIGFEAGSRQITVSKEDLNRSFPGSDKGSLAERIADIIFANICETEPDLVVDMHNDWIKSVPYALVDKIDYGEAQAIFEKSVKFALKTGFLPVLDTDSLSKSLSYNLILKGIPAITLELGESFVVNEKYVDYGIKSIFNLMRELGMMEYSDAPFRHRLLEGWDGELYRFSSGQVSSSSGVIRYLCKPGDHIRKGKPVARIYNAFGKLRETIHAQEEGIALGHSDSSVAYPGAQLIAFAV